VNVSLDEHEKKALDHLVGDLLDEGRLGQALDIAEHFGYFTNDLTIITVSFTLHYMTSKGDLLSLIVVEYCI